jgi:large conductance mechanosensitive channel
MGMLQEFKEFAIRGNVIDLAVGVIIGGAFGKIVSSFVNDIVMPPIGLMLGDVNFKELAYVLKEETLTETGEVATAAVAFNYGMFAQNMLDFTIIAFVIFMAIKAINSLKKKEVEVPAAAPEPVKSEVLLEEIRDLLKNK